MFHTTRGISGLAEDLLANHEGLCSRELVGESVTGSRILERSAAYEIHMVKVRGHAVAQLAEALRYKPEGRRFDSR